MHQGNHTILFFKVLIILLFISSGLFAQGFTPPPFRQNPSDSIVPPTPPDTIPNAFYVSSSAGSDTNSGSFSEPFKTLDKINAFRLIPGDTVLFMGGDTITGSMTSSTVFADTSLKVLFTSYGTGKAIIKCEPDKEGIFTIYFYSRGKYEFNNLIIIGNYNAYTQTDSLNRVGIYAENLDKRTTNTADSNYFVIDSCEFAGFSERGIHLTVLSFYTRGYYRFTNSYYHDIGIDGILIYGIVYSDFNITNNRFVNIYGRDHHNYSSALDMSYCRKVLIDSNYVNNIGLYAKIGGTGLHVGFGKSVTWRRNEVRNVYYTTNEGGALYADVGCDSSLFEYNFVQNSRWGIVLGNAFSLLVPNPSYYSLMPGLVEDSLGASGNIARFNTILLDSNGGNAGITMFGYVPEKAPKTGKLNFIYNNLIYVKNGFKYSDTANGQYLGTGVFLRGFTDSVYIYNNIFIGDSASFITTDTNKGSNFNGLTKDLVVHNNIYWNVAGDSTQYPMSMRVTYKYNSYPIFHFYYRYYTSVQNWADSTLWEKNGGTYTYFFRDPEINDMNSRIYGNYAQYRLLDTLTNFQTSGTSIAIGNGISYNSLISTFADTATHDFYGNPIKNDIGIYFKP